MDFKKIIRNIPDFPEKGVMFKDITTVLKDKDALSAAIDEMKEFVLKKEFDFIASPESRGFIFGMPLSYSLKKGFIPIRKKGKLPAETFQESYDLEYGHDIIEIHKDALSEGNEVFIVDDLLATGGTAKVAANLIEKAGGKVKGFLFFIEFENMGGRELLSGYDVFSIVKY